MKITAKRKITTSLIFTLFLFWLISGFILLNMFSAQYYAESNVQEFREYHNKNLWQVEKELSEINNDIPIVEWITYLGFPLIITTVIIYRVKRFKES